MIYKFKNKDSDSDQGLEIEAVKDKALLTFFGETEVNGIELELDELHKLIRVLEVIASEIRENKELK